MHDGQSQDTVKLIGQLTVDRASTIKDEISQAFRKRAIVLLDFSQVEDLDLACLQVLFSAKLGAAAAGKELHFLGTLPERVSRRLVSCGILRADTDHAEDFETALAAF